MLRGWLLFRDWLRSGGRALDIWLFTTETLQLRHTGKGGRSSYLFLHRTCTVPLSPILLQMFMHIYDHVWRFVPLNRS